MMGPKELTDGIVMILAPLLPYLSKTGTHVAKSFVEGVGKAGGEAAWKVAESLWARLTGAVATDAKLNSAVSLVSVDPEDTDSLTILSKTLQARLEKDEALSQSLLEILGGEAGLQSMVAERGSRISRAKQEQRGTGDQSMTARDTSVIEDATQIIER